MNNPLTTEILRFDGARLNGQQTNTGEEEELGRARDTQCPESGRQDR